MTHTQGGKRTTPTYSPLTTVPHGDRVCIPKTETKSAPCEVSWAFPLNLQWVRFFKSHLQGDVYRQGTQIWKNYIVSFRNWAYTVLKQTNKQTNKTQQTQFSCDSSKRQSAELVFHTRPWKVLTGKQGIRTPSAAPPLPPQVPLAEPEPQSNTATWMKSSFQAPPLPPSHTGALASTLRAGQSMWLHPSPSSTSGRVRK